MAKEDKRTLTPRLRFPEFQKNIGWENTSLGQVVEFQSGGTPSKTVPTFWNGSIPWVTAKDMKQLFLDDTEDHITSAAVDDGAVHRRWEVGRCDAAARAGGFGWTVVGHGGRRCHKHDG